MSPASRSRLRRTDQRKKAPSFSQFSASSTRASKHLAKIKATGSEAERLLGSALWRRGLRFRKNVRELPGTPDIVFSRDRLVVFCDGDFWHGRRWKEIRDRLKKGPNPSYWVAKIARNRERDREHRMQLRMMGWRVLRFWASDILNDHEHIAERIFAILGK